MLRQRAHHQLDVPRLRRRQDRRVLGQPSGSIVIVGKEQRAVVPASVPQHLEHRHNARQSARVPEGRVERTVVPVLLGRSAIARTLSGQSLAQRANQTIGVVCERLIRRTAARGRPSPGTRSRMSDWVGAATLTALCGVAVTKPCEARRRSACTTGIRLTPRSFASRSADRRSPGLQHPRAHGAAQAVVRVILECPDHIELPESRLQWSDICYKP